MKISDLEFKKFELEEKVRLEELAIKKKELELKIREETKKTIFTPLVITIVGGLLTLITGVVLKYFDSQAVNSLEDKKFQSSLLLKAAEATNYDEFSAILLVFQRNGLLTLDSARIYDYRKQKFLADSTKLKEVNNDIVKSDNIRDKESPKIYMIVSGYETNLTDAENIRTKAHILGFTDINIYKKNNLFRTCIGNYNHLDQALPDLFDVREKINPTAYVVKVNDWCNQYKYDSLQKVYYCF